VCMWNDVRRFRGSRPPHDFGYHMGANADRHGASLRNPAPRTTAPFGGFSVGRVNPDPLARKTVVVTLDSTPETTVPLHPPDSYFTPIHPVHPLPYRPAFKRKS